MKKKKLIFIKLGGSLITEKSKVSALRKKVLYRVLDEVVEYSKQSQPSIILGHGQGSFAHIPAQKYQTKKGFITDESVYGMAVTHHSAGYLSRVIIDYLLEKKCAAIKYSVSSCVESTANKAQAEILDVLEAYLQSGLLPVVCGDVMTDTQQGCTVWSTEKVFSHLIKCVLRSGHTVEKVIHVSDVAGVLDETGATIDIITGESFPLLAAAMQKTIGHDVTGGMRHKVEECLALQETWGIPSIIVSGLQKDNLKNCLMNKNFIGTKIG